MKDRILETLQETKRKHPEFTALLDLQREVLTAQLAVKQRLTESPIIDRAEVAARLASGTPALAFDELNLDWPVFERLLVQMAEITHRHEVGTQGGTAVELPSQLEEVAAPRQLRDVGQAWYQGNNPADEVLSPLIASAMWPFLAHAAEMIGPDIDQASWRRGFCHVCGGKPDFACLDRESGARHLFCSRCDTQWLFPRLECPFCGIQDPANLAYYPSEDGAYRLYVCESCRCYLKTIDLRETGRKVLLPIERILTLGMDVAATEAGYRPG